MLFSTAISTLCFIAALCVLSTSALDCITTPQDAACENFQFPNSQDIVTSFCGMMSDMPACTIYNICQNPTYNSSTSANGVCTSFSLATDLCFDMPDMDRASCSNLTSMCTTSSVVRECSTRNLTATMPKWEVLSPNTKSLCNNNSPSASICSRCTSTNWKCDLLTTWTDLCALAPTRTECSAWPTFCNSIQSYNWPLQCTAAAPVSPATPVAPTAPTSPATVDCISTPSNPACANYRIANPGDVVADMCDMMSVMPTCSIRSRVCSKSKWSSSEYCEPSSLMADVCTDMTMGVTGCVNYVSMCRNGTVVKECSEPSLKNVLPTTTVARDLIKDICNSMPMSDCSSCSSGTCDYLTVYSNLCMSMPTMSQCSVWSKFCTAVPNWPYCSTDASGIPEMRMYFHTGFVDYVLFYGWVPRTGVQYAFTWIAIALAGILLELIKFIRARLEKNWLRRGSQYVGVVNSSEEDVSSHHHHSGHSSASSSEYPPWDWRVDIPRSFLAAFELIWSYALMLVAMTFNVGLFFAVVFGCFAGTLIFGRFLVTLPKPKTVSCH